jgi:ribose transport system ATP-binding protein
MNNICKRYGSTVALNDVSVSFETGKVNAIIGKNGSGKSTLVKILSGAVQMDSGEILLDGQAVNISKPADAFSHGIVTVYQETSLVPHLSVAENVLLGHQVRTKYGFVDWIKTRAIAKLMLEKICPDIDVSQRVSDLAVWQMQVVEIAKAMSWNPKILILDEPTSALAQNETDKLFEVVKNLRSQNVAILYITHRLQELTVIADTVTVLRDGDLVGQVDFSETDNSTIINMMFGEIDERLIIDNTTIKDEIVLKVEHLSRRPYFEDISFELRAGEILGIAGMLGSGRSEIVRSIYGADPSGTGIVSIFGKNIVRRNPERMKNAGVGFVPEDRKREGLVLEHSCKANLVLVNLLGIARGGFIRKALENKAVATQINNLSIKLGNIDDIASSLSGGNQQKLVVGKWLNANPSIIIFDEPTRGIDIQTKRQIFRIIQKLSSLGISSIIISSELEEIVENCHRILVLKRGRLVNEYHNDGISSAQLYEECMS